MPIPPISAIDGATGADLIQKVTGAQETDGSGFAASLAGAIDNLQGLSATSNDLAIKAVTGDLDDVHSAMIASTRAAVTLELVAAVRNKSVDAFTEIMRMQA